MIRFLCRLLIPSPNVTIVANIYRAPLKFTRLLSTVFVFILYSICGVAYSQNESEIFCGAPDIDGTDTAGIYMWKDCPVTGSRSTWHITAHNADPLSAIRFIGTVESNYTIKETGNTNTNYNYSYSGLDLSGGAYSDYVEINDISKPRFVKFSLRVKNSWTDTINFSLSTSDAALPLTLRMDSTSQSFDVFAGDQKIQITDPERGVDLVTGYSNAKLADMGYISITDSANNGGNSVPKSDDNDDDTVSIQATIDKAIDEGKNVYFPRGVWQVSNTLRGGMRIKCKSHPAEPPTYSLCTDWDTLDRRKPTSLIGSTAGTSRPIIKLKPITGDLSFNIDDDNDTRKPVIWIYAQNRDGGDFDKYRDNPPNTSFFEIGDGGLPHPREQFGEDINLQPRYNQGSISFNQIVRGIDFDLTANNTAGAIAIRHPGAQGSSISDVKVDLGTSGNANSYAAFDNPPGQGGGLYNVEVNGGQYAVVTNVDVRYPVIVGARFHDQSVAALNLDSSMGAVMVGFHITGNSGVSISSGGAASANNLSLVDGTVELNAGSTFINNPGNKSVYMDNVYFKGQNSYTIISSDNHASSATERAEDYQYIGNNTKAIIDGTEHTNAGSSAGEFRAITNSANIDDPDSLITNHVGTESFPSFEDDDIVNVVDIVESTSYVLDLQDNDADDTDALQYAIDTNKKIFLPAGIYNVTRPLKLRPDSVIIGAGKTIARIMATGKDWTRGNPIIKFYRNEIVPNNQSIYVTDTDLKNATTVLAHVLLESDSRTDPPRVKVRNSAYIEWRAGRDSWVKDIMIGARYQGSHSITTSCGLADQCLSNKPAILIVGVGGGRWHGVFGEWTMLRHNSSHYNFRALSIKHTTEPLKLYGLNIERTRANPQADILGAKNVSIYYLKAESGTPSSEVSDVLHIDNTATRVSSNIKVIGLSGNARPAQNTIQVSDTSISELKLVNISPFTKDTSDFDVIDTGLSGNFSSYFHADEDRISSSNTYIK